MKLDDFTVGQRVRVRQLDVFGTVTAVNQPIAAFPEGYIQVDCDYPLPKFKWLGAPDKVEYSSET